MLIQTMYGACLLFCLIITNFIIEKLPEEKTNVKRGLAVVATGIALLSAISVTTYINTIISDKILLLEFGWQKVAVATLLASSIIGEVSGRGIAPTPRIIEKHSEKAEQEKTMSRLKELFDDWDPGSPSSPSSSFGQFLN